MRTTLGCLLAASLASCPAFADHVATTNDGVGFDGFLTEVDRPGYVGSFNTTQSRYVRVRQAWNDANGDNPTRHYVTVLKFDLNGAAVSANDLIDARLRLTVSDRYGTSPGTFHLGVFVGDDTLITEELGYNAENPFIASDYVGETNPDTDFEPGTVSQLLTYTHSGRGEVDEVGRDHPALLAAVQEALNTDSLITFLIYGPNDGSNPTQTSNTSEYYILPGEAESGGPVLELIDTPAPYLGATPTEGYAGDPLQLNWYVDPAATDLAISSDTGNDEIGDVTANTASNGLGELAWTFPLEDTNYTLDYTLNGSPQSHSVSVVVLDPFFTMDPDEAVPGSTSLQFAWRIEPGASPVILESGPTGGPYILLADVTADTDAIGAGSYNAIAADGQTEYRLRYTDTSGEVILSDTLTLADSSFEALVVSSENGINPEISPDFALGDLAYLDRDYTWTDLPDFLLGSEQVLTAVDDKATNGYELTLETNEDGTLFLLIDNRIGDPLNNTDDTPTIAGATNRMAWVKTLGFVDSGMDASTDVGTTQSIFFRPITAGERLMLGEQDDGSSRVMYTLALATPAVALDGFGAMPDQVSQYRPTTLSWAVPAGSTVEIDGGIGDVTASTDAGTGIGSIDTAPFMGLGDFTYSLTYTPSGGSPVVLGPIDVEVIPGPENSFTAAPEMVTPGQTVTLTIQIPPVATNVSVVPIDEDFDPIEELRTPVTLNANGFAEIEVIAPAIDTDYLEYELAYTFDGGEENDYAGVDLLLDPEFNVTPPVAFAGLTELAIGWRVPANPTAVTLEYGPDAGNTTSVDVLGLTEATTGSGATTLIPTLQDTEFFLSWQGTSDDELDASIEVYETTLQSIAPTNYNTNPVIFDQPLVPGVRVFNDRTFAWQEDVPDEIRGAQFVQHGTDNSDKNGSSIQMNVTSDVDGTMFLIIDDRVGDNDNTNGPTVGQGVMNWVPQAGFVDSDLNVTIDHDDGNVAPVVMSVFVRPVTSGETVSLGAQADGTGRTLFVTGVAAGAIDASNFWATPTSIEEGQMSTLQWIVPAGSTVEIDQGVGDVTSLTDGTTGMGSTTVSPALGETSYTLTYTPTGGDPTVLGPITVTVTAGGGGGDDGFVIGDITVDPSSGEVGFKWPAPEGVTDPANLDDVVYSSIDLITWTEVTDGELMIADGMVMFSDPTPPEGGKAFYRIERP